MNASIFQRLLWNIDRFGLSPRKLPSRMTKRSGHPIVSNSLPKAGTHLLERALCLTPQIYRAPLRTIHRRRLPTDLAKTLDQLKPHQLIVAHLEYTEDRAQAVSDSAARLLFMVRDPRDIVVSQSHFIPDKRRHAHRSIFAGITDPGERMRLVITGSPASGYPSLRQRLEEYQGWLDEDCLLIRYEDLVGPKGGRDRALQLETLRNLYGFIGLDPSTLDLDGLASELFSDASPTFRRGTTQQWRSQFDDRTLDLFERTAGDLASRFGYPHDETEPEKNENSDVHQ